MGNSILAPADGYVIYIKKINPHQLKSRKGIRKIPWDKKIQQNLTNNLGILVGILMPPLAVHRNRAPISGIVIKQSHKKPSKNKSLVKLVAKLTLKIPIPSSNDSSNDNEYLSNERCSIIIANNSQRVAVTQIAGKGISHIINWSKVNHSLKRGEQYGMIRFGSQCDLFIDNLSDEFAIEVALGEYVYAGETIIYNEKPTKN